MELPLREQGTLLTGVRGCDVAPKTPNDLASTERRLSAFLRYCFMNPADSREVDSQPGCFFRSMPPTNWRASELGHFPLHYYSHIMHCFEVVAYRHPSDQIKLLADEIYNKLATGLHLNPESLYGMATRLSEDRIKNENVVS